MCLRARACARASALTTRRASPDPTQPALVTVRADADGATEALIGGLGAARWEDFQREAHALKLRADEAEAKAEAARAALRERAAAVRALETDVEGAPAEGPDGGAEVDGGGEEVVRRARCTIVLVAGFESFNKGLYAGVAEELRARCGDALEVLAFSDRDLDDSRDEIEAALKRADCVFASLVFDYDQVEWLRERVADVPVRLVFESALELMSLTRVGTFEMKPKADGSKAGPPPAVKAVLSKFGSGKEEDKLAGYLSFLKVGPKLLRWVPGRRARDLRNWLSAYAYWNQGGGRNVASMLVYLANEVLGVDTGLAPEAVEETPALGLWHPALPGGRPMTSAREYLRWHRESYTPALGKEEGNGGGLAPDAPTVAVLLYRKHVITRQGYIWQLLLGLERKGLRPLPIFINGVEAHTVVRDLLTTPHEAEARAAGIKLIDSLKEGECVEVDAIVSTIGFPLVGGPAGSMEGARQAEIAGSILAAKNVPYVVAAPLLVQDVWSWTRSGVAGLQSVVLYALPELDGAVDTVALGALSGDNIVLLQERVDKLADRLNGWVGLARKRNADKRVALMVYGFPPGVGATGTAALLNVPKSLEATLDAMRAKGYDLGPLGDVADLSGYGETIVAALERLSEPRLIAAGRAPRDSREAGGNPLLDPESEMCCAAVHTVAPSELAAWLEDGGGGVGLRDARSLRQRVEAQWGELERYRGIMTTSEGESVVAGLQLGSVFIGVQPLLGVEGDPMRLLFERDLTPHPQYAAHYMLMERAWGADAYVHMGMHGTAEWLPGSPLGNTADSWSDALMGGVPNVYVYAANNPSESIVAKRRGYGTIVSHNVPPYGRAGLYKQLATMRDLLAEFREDPVGKGEDLRGAIAQTALSAGLEKDCPFAADAEETREFSVEVAEAAAPEVFGDWASRLWAYLQTLESRLFSEGLHTLGAQPSPAQLGSYLEAYLGERLPAVSARVPHEPFLAPSRALRGSFATAVEREVLTERALRTHPARARVRAVARARVRAHRRAPRKPSPRPGWARMHRRSTTRTRLRGGTRARVARTARGRTRRRVRSWRACARRCACASCCARRPARSPA